MEPGEFKPILAALVLPPAGPLLLAFLGLLVARRRRAFGLALTALSLGALWLLSAHAVAVLLARNLLPQQVPLDPAQMETVQAVVVLGAGVQPEAPEFGAPQPSGTTLARLRYGAWLARRADKPLAFAGGIGWAATGAPTTAEGTIARRVLEEEYGLPPRWLDDRSRDTRENALAIAGAMKPDRIRRIALVTDAWHMPRAVRHFQAAGFDVVPAPTGFPSRRDRAIIEWLPSGSGLALSQLVLREWLALKLGAWAA
jgi:uncharacterized SAM-binding protein YcdF (DUF218 family)